MKNKRRTYFILILISIFIINTVPSQVFAAAGLWPENSSNAYNWYAYAKTDNSLIYDPADQSPADADIISIDGILPSVYVASDGTNIYFRYRLRGDPRLATRFIPSYWIVEIAAEDSGGNFVHVATAGLQGGNPSNVFVASSFGSTTTTVYSGVVNNGQYAKAFATNDGYPYYFLQFQVPISSINAVSGQNGLPVITGDTPVKFYYGTSTNPIHIGKDYMDGSSVSFDNLLPVTLDDLDDTLSPKLSADKTGPDEIAAGSQITYELTIRNLGPGDATNVHISDPISSQIENAEYSLNNGASWQPWNGVRILPTFMATPGINNILIRGDVKSDASGTIINTVTVTSDDADTVSDTVSTDIISVSDLSVEKTITSGTVDRGNPISYLIKVTNNGPSDAYNVTITDTIDPDDISNVQYYDISDSTWKSWSGSLNIGTLTNGSEYGLQIRGTVAETSANPLSNTASVSSDSTDPDALDNSVSINSPLTAIADISISKSAPVSAVAGEDITYTITITNQNETGDTATNVILYDYLPSDITDAVYSLDGGSNWTAWNEHLSIGDLLPLESVEILISGTLKSSAVDTVLNHASVTSDTPDSNTENNEDTTVTSIEQRSDIVVIKTLITPPDKIIAGSMVEYLITYRNDGPSDANNVIITDIFDSNISNVEASRCRSSYFIWEGSYNAGTVTAGFECTIIYKGVLNSSAIGTLTNTAEISSDSTDPNEENNTSTTNSTINTISDLYIVKTPSANTARVGDTITYTIYLDNLGTSDALNVNLTDILPSGLSLDNASASIGNWAAPVWHIDTLPGGGTANLILTTTVQASAEGTTIVNTASADTDTTDANSQNDNSSASTTISYLQELTIDGKNLMLNTTNQILTPSIPEGQWTWDSDFVDVIINEDSTLKIIAKKTGNTKITYTLGERSVDFNLTIYETAPNTGEDMPYIYLIFLSSIIAIVTVLYLKYRNKKNDGRVK